jgi:hypothetical protein
MPGCLLNNNSVRVPDSRPIAAEEEEMKRIDGRLPHTLPILRAGARMSMEILVFRERWVEVLTGDIGSSKSARADVVHA